MNFYFIIIGSLQIWKDVTPVNPLTSWVPIIIIFGITFLREGIDDFRQHQLDDVYNSRLFDVFRGSTFLKIKSDEIIVGDLIRLQMNEEAPADLVLLKSFDGVCLVETSNLDGETNLKIRSCLTSAQRIQNTSDLNGRIKCIPPSHNLYEFSGTFYSTNNEELISSDNFIQRGVKIKNIESVICCVVYTGKETKLGMNRVDPPVKWTNLDRRVNTLSTFIFIFQVILAFILGNISFVWMKNNWKIHQYLRYDLTGNPVSPFYWLVHFIRCYLLTSLLIPVSLKLTIDVAKWIYQGMIISDNQMSSTRNANVNNSTVIEDLGSIEYIFSDKTGTLTENKMKFQCLAIPGKIYWSPNEIPVDYDPSIDINLCTAVQILSLCHTVVFKDDKLFSTSPEETAFLNGLLQVGFHFDQSDRFLIKLNQNTSSFEILHTLKFTYERKRMSVIVRDIETQKIFLLTKGGTDVVSSLCVHKYEEYQSQVEQFSSFGYRVMGLAFKILEDEEVASFESKIRECRLDLMQRNELESEAFQQLENQLTLIAVVGILDSLQKGVPDTIQILRDANIKIWMITGDIISTAKQVALSAKIVSNDGPLINISPQPDTDWETILSLASDIVLEKKIFYLIFTGDVDPQNNKFLNLVLNAKSVIVARSTPKQKAMYVEMVKSLGKTTLSIGDGGNDIQMIQCAQIGVGIVGNEGMEAGAAADFSISQFRFLQKLLLIHGRLSAYRTSWLCQFCFYKSTLIVIIQIGFLFYNGFSGTSFLNSFNLMVYNAILTLLPVIFFLIDKDLQEETVYLHPFVYQDSQKHLLMNKRSVLWWYFKAFYQGILCVLIPHNVFNHNFVSIPSGSAISLDEAQQVVYSAVILIVCTLASLETKHFTFFSLLFTWGNFILYLLIISFANMISNMNMLKEMNGVVWRMLSDPVQWMIVFLLVSICVFPPFLIDSLIAIIFPSRSQRIRDFEISLASRGSSLYSLSYSSLSTAYEIAKEKNIQTCWDDETAFSPCCSSAFRHPILNIHSDDSRSMIETVLI